MSEEVKEHQENGTSMYVHQLEYETFLALMERVTDVNKTFTYSMPKKAQSYAGNGFELITTLNEYIDGEEDWRITRESNVKLQTKDKSVIIGTNTVINGTNLIMCIPRINSILIIPDENSFINGVKDPTKIIQLTNCIAVTPLLMRLLDEKSEEDPEKFVLGMTYEVIIPKKESSETEEPAK